MGGRPGMTVSVAIVTYNSAHTLGPLTASLQAQRGVDFEVLITDNASTDRTVELLEKLQPGACRRNLENSGYTRAQNQNIARSQGRYLLFLNPDVSFGSELLTQMAQFLDAHPEFAIAGPTVLEGPDGTCFPPRLFYPGEGMSPLEPAWVRTEIAWVNGCCLMIRREVLEELGGLDTAFFLYQEETDLCFRARRRGHRIGWCEAAELQHSGKQSQTDLSKMEKARRVYEGNVTFWQKHYAPETLAAMMRFQVGVCRLLLWLRPSVASLPGIRRESLLARLAVCEEWERLSGRRARWVEINRILLRQAALLARWVLRGSYPLDDY